MPIRPSFIVVDDHPLYRHGVTMLIGQELRLECAGEAGGIPEALELLAATSPRMAIVDISLQGQSGLDLVRLIKADYPETIALVVSMHEENLYGERALKAGARGYVMKHESPAVLVNAVREVLEGRIAVSEALARADARRPRRGQVRRGSGGKTLGSRARGIHPHRQGLRSRRDR